MPSRRHFLTASALAAATTARAAEPDPPKPYRFTYGLNAATLMGQKLPLAQQLEVAAQAGYDGYEPWLSDLARHARGGSLKDLGKRCRDLGLRIYGSIGFAEWIVDDDARRGRGIENLKRDMAMVADLGGSHIAAPPMGATAKPLDLDRMAERYHAILEIGAGLGVVPQLEIWGHSANVRTLAEALDIAARAAHPAAHVLPDVFHLYKGGTDPAALRLLGRAGVHDLHMNDYAANPPRAAITDASRLWPGDGIAPLKDLLTALADNHCEMVLSLELFNPEYYKLPALEAARTGLAKMKAVVAAAGLA
jgi:sugar phosphate isomerase/epimerase